MVWLPLFRIFNGRADVDAHVCSRVRVEVWWGWRLVGGWVGVEAGGWVGVGAVRTPRETLH